MKDHDEIQGHINEIRESLGQPLSSTKPKKGSITKSNIDFLKLELEKMRAEKVRIALCMPCYPLCKLLDVFSTRSSQSPVVTLHCALSVMVYCM